MKNVNMKLIFRYFRWLGNELFTEYNQHKLSARFQEKIDKFYSVVKSAIDWYDLTTEDLIALGFMQLNEDTESEEYWAIPAWLFPTIPEGIMLQDEHHNWFAFDSSTASTNIFYGCLSYGLIREKVKDEIDDSRRETSNNPSN